MVMHCIWSSKPRWLTPSHPDVTGVKFRQEVQDATWQLVQISNDLNDSACAALTGDLLAIIGTFPSGAIVHRQPATLPIVTVSGSFITSNQPASGGRKSSGMASVPP